MRSFVAVDPEGQVGKGGLLGCAFWSADRQCYLTDHDAIRAELERHARAGRTFVMHNLSHDIALLFWELDIPATAIYYNHTLNRGEWKYAAKRGPAELWDSVDLSGGLSLAELGAALGLPKYAQPQRLRGIDPDRYAWLCERHGRGECVECYALRDAEIVYRFVESFVDTLDIWGVRPARRLGGNAVAVWKSLDPRPPIRIQDGRIRWLARQAYVGGRVEVFKLGRFSPLYGADIESCYPSIMASTLFPDPDCMGHVWAIHPDRLPLYLEGVADVEIAVPPCYVPPAPYVHNGSRLFPCGVLRGTFTLIELRYALSLGCDLRRVHRAAWSDRSVSPFATTIGVLWELREQFARKSDPREQTAKSLMNQLYGRFGMRPKLWEERIQLLGPGAPREAKRDVSYHREGRKLFSSVERPIWFDHRWVNELWAAQITAAARVKLHQLLLLQGDALVYCDTDSILSMAPIQGLGEGLGQLSGHTTYLEGTISGPKLYSLVEVSGDERLVAKGVRPTLARAFLAGEQVVWEQPITPREMVRGKGQAGVWIPVHRERQLVPHRRTPTHPERLQNGFGWSDTVAPVVG